MPKVVCVKNLPDGLPSQMNPVHKPAHLHVASSIPPELKSRRARPEHMTAAAAARAAGAAPACRADAAEAHYWKILTRANEPLSGVEQAPTGA